MKKIEQVEIRLEIVREIYSNDHPNPTPALLNLIFDNATIQNIYYVNKSSHAQWRIGLLYLSYFNTVPR